MTAFEVGLFSSFSNLFFHSFSLFGLDVFVLASEHAKTSVPRSARLPR